MSKNGPGYIEEIDFDRSVSEFFDPERPAFHDNFSEFA